jgi:hypothetical protein
MSHIRVSVAMAVGFFGLNMCFAGVIPALPGEFGGAIVETFEGIAGVSLPLVPWGELITPMSELPNPYVLPSGASYHSNNPRQARVFDYAAPGYSGGPENWGWGLSLEGGDIHYRTPLPSGQAFFGAYCGWAPLPEPPGTVMFDLPVPAQKVGAYVESSLWIEIGYDGVVVLEAFDALGQSLGSVSVVTDGVTSPGQGPPYPNGLDTWIGLATDDGAFSIYSIALHGRNVVADDLMFVVVPEPACALVLAVAFACVVRRRQPMSACSWVGPAWPHCSLVGLRTAGPRQ